MVIRDNILLDDSWVSTMESKRLKWASKSSEKRNYNPSS